MNTTLMNSKNSKTSDPHILLLNLTEKINLKRSDRYVTSSNLNLLNKWKIYKSHIRTTNVNINSSME